MARKLKILIVEDEEAIWRGLVDVFVYHGYEVMHAGDGKRGLELALSGEYDLLLLDVMLPLLDGFSVCNQVRAKDRSQPIIMLTAKTSDEDIVNGLRLGADDYVSKPFSVQELVLRVEAVLRRSDKLRRESQILELSSGLKIDTRSLLGKSDADTTQTVEFTRREVEILEYLHAHRDRPVQRGELLEQVWGYRKAASVDTRTVDIHIAKLRRKIEANHADPKLLVTVRGEGYQLL